MANEEIKLPRDIKVYVLKRVIKRVFLAVLVQIALASIFWFFGDQIFGSFSQSNRIILYTALLFAVPFAFGVPFKLIDRTWIGEIEKVSVSTKLDWHGVKPTYESMYVKVYVDLCVRLENGKTLERRILADDIIGRQNFDVYENGDKIVHIYGTDHVQIITKKVTEPRICIICGTSNPQNERTCTTCGHTLNII